MVIDQPPPQRCMWPPPWATWWGVKPKWRVSQTSYLFSKGDSVVEALWVPLWDLYWSQVLSAINALSAPFWTQGEALVKGAVCQNVLSSPWKPQQRMWVSSTPCSRAKWACAGAPHSSPEDDLPSMPIRPMSWQNMTLLINNVRKESKDQKWQTCFAETRPCINVPGSGYEWAAHIRGARGYLEAGLPATTKRDFGGVWKHLNWHGL